jgi:magnesium-transporting ATPase (P-type)
MYHMSKGKRVLALAYKKLAATKNINRDAMESQLIFAGFLVFDCDLKPDSKSVVKELMSSNHKVVMITGDSTFTAIDVAKRLGMLRGKPKTPVEVLILHHLTTPGTSGNSVVWRKSDSFDSPDQGIEHAARFVRERNGMGCHPPEGRCC